MKTEGWKYHVLTLVVLPLVCVASLSFAAKRGWLEPPKVSTYLADTKDIGNDITRTRDSEMGVVCYQRFTTLSCVPYRTPVP